MPRFPIGVPERVLGGSLAGLMVVLAFSHTTAMIRLLMLTGLVAAGVLAWRERGAWRDLLPPFALPFAAWIAWCVLSLAWSIEPALTVSELRAEVLYPVAMLAITLVAMRHRGVEVALLPAAALACVILASTALFWFATRTTVEYYGGPFGGPGNLSSTVLVVFPVACAAAFAPGATRGVRRLGWLMAAALVAAGLTTLNRTLGPALALEFVLVAVLVQRGRLPMRRLSWIAALALAFAFLQAGLAYEVRFTDPAPGAAPNGHATEDPRLDLWAHAVDRIAGDPLVGQGFGREILGRELREKFANPLLSHAHNIFLDAGLQLGIPGIVLLAVLFAAIAGTGVRLVRSEDPVARACGAALVAVVLGTLVRNFSDNLWIRQNALLFWAVAGILTGLGLRHFRDARAAR